jgi:carboxypeptidase C (cathepsin A)
MVSLKRAVLGSVLLSLFVAPVLAQPAPGPGRLRDQNRPAQQEGQRAGAPAGPQGERAQGERKLPPDSITQHVLELPGRTLRFKATAGALQLVDPNGGLQAEIGYVAYTLDGAEAGSRPVTFAVNGGPGAASAYLHLGVLGPWRLPLDGSSISPSAPPAVVPNPETWLDFTDLVFIDPVNTGYSRASVSGEDLANRYFSVDSDIETLAAVVARWLRTNDRLESPKFFVGESYGGFRGPLLAARLQKDTGIGFSGLTLLSPVFDFAWLRQASHSPWGYAAHLPSYAAACRERSGPVSRERLRDAESYASGEYLTDLFRGVQEREAVDRMSARVASFVCLDPPLIRRLAGRIDMGTFQRELMRTEGRVTSAYDAGVTGFDPDPTAAVSRFEDPGLAAMTAPLTSAIISHLSTRLNWKVADQRYNLLNGSVNGAWRWNRGRGPAEAISDLRQALALDGNLRVLVVHGYADLVTPYFASELLLRQVPDYGSQGRLQLVVYPGGHMFYSRDASRTTFRDDAARMYRAALDARTNGTAAP